MAMSITEERQLAEAVRDWADEHGVPRTAPVPMAEQLAVMALRDGASLEQARAQAERYLCSWLRHPSHGSSRPRLALVHA